MASNVLVTLIFNFNISLALEFLVLLQLRKISDDGEMVWGEVITSYSPLMKCRGHNLVKHE